MKTFLTNIGYAADVALGFIAVAGTAAAIYHFIFTGC